MDDLTQTFTKYVLNYTNDNSNTDMPKLYRTLTTDEFNIGCDLLNKLHSNIILVKTYFDYCKMYLFKYNNKYYCITTNFYDQTLRGIYIIDH